MSSHKCLIIGGGGFIGSRTALQLLTRGHSVRILDSFDPQIHGSDLKASATLRSIWSDTEIHVGDARDTAAVERALQGIDSIYYFAAGTGTGQSMYQVRLYTDVNVNGSAVLSESLMKKKGEIHRVVISSSRAVYGEGAYQCVTHGRVFPNGRQLKNLERGSFNPLCPKCGDPIEELPSQENDSIQPTSIYGITKYAQEQIVLSTCASASIPSVAFRYQNVYGPGQSLKNPYTGILSIFTQLVRSNSDINIFEDGLASRDFVFIDDVVEYNIRAIEAEMCGMEILNLGTGIRQSILDVLNGICTSIGKQPRYTVSGQYRIGDIRHATADTRRLLQVLGENKFVSFSEGVHRFVQWALQQEVDSQAANRYKKSLDEMKALGLFEKAKTSV